MQSSCFTVLTSLDRWTFWTIPFVLGRISSKFDDPHHPFGQWTVRLNRVSGPAPEGSCRLKLEFLMPEAPWREIQPGSILPCYYGATFIADLEVEADNPV